MASHFQDMSRLRQGTLLAAFTYSIIFTVFGVWTEMSRGSIMDAIFGLPPVILVPFLLFHTLLSAVGLVELVRGALDGCLVWSDRRHLYTVAICWILLFTTQVPMIVITHVQEMGVN